MPNQLYPKGAEKMLKGEVNFATDNIAAALIPSTYTFSDAHEFLSSAGTLVGTKQALAGKSTTGGVFGADNVGFGAVAAGSTTKGVVLFKDTGNPATSPLLIYLDEVTGFPMSTNGASIDIEWPTGAAKILSLVP